MKKLPLSKLLLVIVLVGVAFVVAHAPAKQPGASSHPQTASKNTRQDSVKKSESKKTQKTDQTAAQRAPKQVAIASKIAVNKRYYLLSAPNDPKYSSQWVFSNMNVPAAWDITNNSNNVVVADIDTGFALNHQDLINQWHLNSGEMGDGKESNGIDDDGNGYVDDWRGWDFYNVDNSPQAGTSNPNSDGVDHGTETAGLIGATTNNSLGMASVSGGASIMPLQVMSDNGEGYSDDITAAIYYAVDNGAQVINMSLGTSGDDSVVREAVDYAISHNVVVIAAAGNCGNNDQDVCSGQTDGYITFPASYDRVVAVGAVDQSNIRASFSSYGQRIDVVAPGSGSVISTTYTAGNATSAYATNLYGTSFASPITASAAALIRSIRPNSSVDDVRALLMAATSHPAGMSGNYYTNYYGHGLLDVGKIMQVANDLNNTTEQEPTLFTAGNNKAEKQFSASDALGAGCQATAETWCTVWLRNTTASYDRFLPYELTNSDGEAGWNWKGAILQSGEWSVRARQGDTTSSTPTLIFSK